MAIIRAYEVFYSRVEGSYSLNNRTGYQVVYQSPGLHANVVHEVEGNVRCFDATQVGVRYQYFHLSSGQVAIAASQEIDPVSTQITDRAGRPGPFITHCLILDAGDFAQIGNNPFVVIESSDGFVLNVEAMIAIQRQAVPYRELEIELETDSETDYTSFDVEGWKPDMFARLWYVASDARTILASRRGVGLQAEDDEEKIYSVLRLLMQYLPSSLRYFCTFSTFVDSCEPAAGSYWALGGFRRTKLPNAIRVRLDRHTVDYETASPDSEITTLAQSVYVKLREAQGYDEENKEESD